MESQFAARGIADVVLDVKTAIGRRRPRILMHVVASPGSRTIGHATPFGACPAFSVNVACSFPRDKRAIGGFPPCECRSYSRE